MHKLVKYVKGKKYIINIPDYNDYYYGAPDFSSGGGISEFVTGSLTGSMASIPMVWEAIPAVWEIIHP
jgi:hypothetical protein